MTSVTDADPENDTRPAPGKVHVLFDPPPRQRRVGGPHASTVVLGFLWIVGLIAVAIRLLVR